MLAACLDRPGVAGSLFSPGIKRSTRPLSGAVMTEPPTEPNVRDSYDAGTPRWVKMLGVVAIALILLGRAHLHR